MLEPPLIDECVFSLIAPAASGLRLTAWEIRLQRNPDPANGEVAFVEIPSDVGGGYVAIAWDEGVQISGATDQPGECAYGGRIASVTAGSRIELQDGVDAARVAVLGLDTVSRTISPLSRGTTPFPPVADPLLRVDFIARVFRFGENLESALLEQWPRPGFLLTTIDGPQIGDDRQPIGDPTQQLDFFSISIDRSVTLSRGPNRDEVAFLFDYRVDGDPVDIRFAQGCRYRCWAGTL